MFSKLFCFFFFFPLSLMSSSKKWKGRGGRKRRIIGIYYIFLLFFSFVLVIQLSIWIKKSVFLNAIPNVQKTIDDVFFDERWNFFYFCYILFCIKISFYQLYLLITHTIYIFIYIYNFLVSFSIVSFIHCWWWYRKS